jgi:lysophospholipase L1-like esterase
MLRPLMFAAVLALAAPAAAQAPTGLDRFAPEFAAFAAQDAAGKPAACQVLFVGSSSVRFWKTLKDDMAPAPVLNRGFGGSQIADVDAAFDKVVAAYRPRAIFFYAGDNDLHAGKAPETVVADFQRFMDLKTKALGDAPVYFIAVKPSKARLSEKPQQDAVNARIREMAQARADLDFVDIVPTMMDGAVPKDIFVADGLHMTPEGYRLWTAVVKPAVDREMQRKSDCA